MPFITVKALEGKTIEQKRELVKRINEAVCDVFEVQSENVFIFFEDMPHHNYGKRGELYPYLQQPVVPAPSKSAEATAPETTPAAASHETPDPAN